MFYVVKFLLFRLEKEMQSMQESLKNRRPSEPIKLNNFSKSEAVLNRQHSQSNGEQHHQVTTVKGKPQQANTVQTIVVGTTTSTAAAAAAASPPKGNGFVLKGPVTDL